MTQFTHKFPSFSSGVISFPRENAATCLLAIVNLVLSDTALGNGTSSKTGFLPVVSAEDFCDISVKKSKHVFHESAIGSALILK